MAAIPIHIITYERFSDDCRNTSTKVIPLTNHNRGKQGDEPIGIADNHLSHAQRAGKSRLKVAIDFGFASHWLKKLEQDFYVNHYA